MVHAHSGTLLDTLSSPFSNLQPSGSATDGGARMVSFSPQNRYLAVVYAGTSVAIWNLKATPRKPVRTFAPFSWDRRATAVAWDRAGEHLVLGDSDGNVWVYVVATGRLHCYSLSKCLAHPSLENSADNAVLQLGGVSSMSSSPYRRGVFLISTDAGHILSMDLYAAGLTSATVSVVPIPSPHTPGTPLSAIHHSPVNNLLAFSAGLDGKCVFFDTSLRKVVKTLHHPPGAISAACFLEDGAHIVVLSRRENGRAYLYDLRKAAGSATTSSSSTAASGALNVIETNGASIVFGGLSVSTDAKPVPGQKEREEWIRPDVPMSLANNVSSSSSSSSTLAPSVVSTTSTSSALLSSTTVNKTNDLFSPVKTTSVTANTTSIRTVSDHHQAIHDERSSILSSASSTDIAPVRDSSSGTSFSPYSSSTMRTTSTLNTTAIPSSSMTAVVGTTSSAKNDLFSPVRAPASSSSIAHAPSTLAAASAPSSLHTTISPLSRPSAPTAAAPSSTVIPDHHSTSPFRKGTQPSTHVSVTPATPQTDSEQPLQSSSSGHVGSTAALSPVPLSFASSSPQQAGQPSTSTLSTVVPTMSAQSSDILISLLSSTMDDAIMTLREQLHGDVQNMHLEMIRQFATQQQILEETIERMVGPVIRELVKEVKNLREENERLRNLY